MVIRGWKVRDGFRLGTLYKHTEGMSSKIVIIVHNDLLQILWRTLRDKLKSPNKVNDKQKEVLITLIWLLYIICVPYMCIINCNQNNSDKYLIWCKVLFCFFFPPIKNYLVSAFLFRLHNLWTSGTITISLIQISVHTQAEWLPIGCISH